MRRAREVISGFLAILWLASTCHVLLERAGLIHQEEQHNQSASDSDDGHDAADGRCVLSGNAPLAFAPASCVLFEIGCYLEDGNSRERVFELHSCGLAPPKEDSILISSWQFCRRTALSPRAPSLFS
jgi:hypothetical protein